MKQLWLILLFSCSGTAWAQSFKAEASLPSPRTDGFYRILITPPISRHLNNDLTDIRIFDDKSQEVPYFLDKELPSYQAEHFMEYHIISKESKVQCCTALMLHNEKRTPINNIQLIIKNADAWREASLLGSDDKKQWYAIKDHFVLQASVNTSATQQLEVVGFPWSNYEFYLLKIKDSVNAPLNILKAGYYETELSSGNYTSLAVKTTVTDSASQKKTYVKLQLSGTQFVDKIEFNVSGAKYYRRNATLFEKRSHIPKKGKRTEYYRPVHSFELTSSRTTIIEPNELRGHEFLVEIENQDNPPLSISSIQVFQLNRYLTAWLSSDLNYTMKFGAQKLNAPVYDLAFFKDSIPDQIELIQPGNVKMIARAEAATSKSLFSNKNIIWIAIIVVMIVLAFMSAKLVREASK